MKASRFLLALPAFVIAAATASACSSSSPGGTGSGTSCATLAACCSKLGAPGTSNFTTCTTVSAGGNEGSCASELAQGGVSAACAAGGGSSSGSNGHSSTGTSTGSSGHSTSGQSSTTNNSSGSGGGTCASPPSTAPTGFAPPTALTAPGCTSAQTQQLAGCDVATTDAGQNACNDTLTMGAADGSLNNCGNCILTEAPPVGPYPTTWGYEVLAILEPTPGDVADAYAVNFGQNFGGCIMAASSSAGAQACGKAIMAATACQLAVCEPLCGVANPGAGQFNQSEVNALVNCWSATTAVGGACVTYQTAAQSACPAETNDAGTGPFDLCNNLINQDDGVDGSAAPTQASQAALIGLMCGGADAGF